MIWKGVTEMTAKLFCFLEELIFTKKREHLCRHSRSLDLCVKDALPYGATTTFTQLFVSS